MLKRIRIDGGKERDNNVIHEYATKWEFSWSLLYYSYQIKMVSLNARYEPSLNEYK